MGVDYNANFGIGYKVVDARTEEQIEEVEFLYYLEEELEKTDYWCFETGDGWYTGNENEFFVVLKEPFKNGVDLTEDKMLLGRKLKSLDVEIDGDFDLHGDIFLS